MIDENVKKIFENVRIISVGKLAKDLGVETGTILSRLPGWESQGFIRVVRGGGCSSCAGCGDSGCAPEDVTEESDEKITLISLVKELHTSNKLR